VAAGAAVVGQGSVLDQTADRGGAAGPGQLANRAVLEHLGKDLQVALGNPQVVVTLLVAVADQVQLALAALQAGLAVQERHHL